ncbi:hypothetical protein C8D77_1356 [Mesorhizobium loti]|uniref:Uncharacterized protein n=2 Tax=Rhizobium loti TaxID=381 RepID=A0A8E2W7C4_RHILI|nr:hypothetical protein C8D77_1356 [Mesorhizobium loti]
MRWRLKSRAHKTVQFEIPEALRDLIYSLMYHVSLLGAFG